MITRVLLLLLLAGKCLAADGMLQVVNGTLTAGPPATNTDLVVVKNLYVETNSSVGGVFSATNGVASLKNNRTRPASISVGASPFSFTNSQPVNIQVFLECQGQSATIAFNGTTIFTSASDHTIILQPGEWLDVTYTATPTMKYHEF